jgi:hypothetical protein
MAYDFIQPWYRDLMMSGRFTPDLGLPTITRKYYTGAFVTFTVSVNCPLEGLLLDRERRSTFE